MASPPHIQRLEDMVGLHGDAFDDFIQWTGNRAFASDDDFKKAGEKFKDREISTEEKRNRIQDAWARGEVSDKEYREAMSEYVRAKAAQGGGS